MNSLVMRSVSIGLVGLLLALSLGGVGVGLSAPGAGDSSKDGSGLGEGLAHLLGVAVLTVSGVAFLLSAAAIALLVAQRRAGFWLTLVFGVVLAAGGALVVLVLGAPSALLAAALGVALGACGVVGLRSSRG